MQKVILLFKGTSAGNLYWSENLRIRDGRTAKVEKSIADRLVRNFPDNFYIIDPSSPLIKLKKPLTRLSIRLSRITVISIHYHPGELEKFLLPTLPEEVEFIKLENEGNKSWTSAAKALNHGIRKSRNDIVICAHENLTFGEDWFNNFIVQEERLKNWGALGLAGKENDQGVEFGYNISAPTRVQTLDEYCIIVNRKNGIWFDEKTFTSFHAYAQDFCLQCLAKGLEVYVVAGKHRHHHITTPHPSDWCKTQEVAKERMRKKWHSRFPIIYATTGAIQ